MSEPLSSRQEEREAPAAAEEPVAKSKAQMVAQMVVRLGVFAVVILGAGGSWRWAQGWLFVGMYGVWAVLMGTWLVRHDPALLRERMRMSPIQKDQKTWDKLFTVAFLVVGVPLIVLPGIDAARLGWTHVGPGWATVGFLVHLPAFWLIYAVMKENTYLSRVVKIDAARGHTVVTTGPYRVVRHPMYVAVIVMVLAMPLALGSWLALIPAVLMAGLIVGRTWFEDRTLHEELAGYAEYAKKTPWRLVPGIF